LKGPTKEDNKTKAVRRHGRLQTLEGQGKAEKQKPAAIHVERRLKKKKNEKEKRTKGVNCRK